MNLAEPSGSSPPEKPPGRNTIWLRRMAASSARTEESSASGVRLRTTTVSASSPARRTARALSYSQLVPGNTGISTRGFAVPILGAARVNAGASRTGAGPSAGTPVGYTSASTASLRDNNSSIFAQSLPIVIIPSAVVTPRRTMERGSVSISSVSSARMAPLAGAYQSASSSGSAVKPIRLPKDIFITPSAGQFSTAQAAFTLPAWQRPWKVSQRARLSSGLPHKKAYTGCPGSLNSGERTSPARTGAMAKEMRVGGTSRSIKDPDMESLPPMAGRPYRSWASRAPSRAAKGLPQRLGSSRSFSKNSWKVR